MALPTYALKQTGSGYADEQDPRTSPEIDWAWARIFSDFEQRPAVFTDSRLPDNPIQYATPAFCALTGYTSDEVEEFRYKMVPG